MEDFERTFAATASAESSTAEAAAPVFIQSCYRSGSTLLRFILDTHPEIYSPPELLLGQTACRMCDFLTGLEGRQFNFTNREEISPDIFAEVRRFLTHHMESAAQRQGKRLWCEKSPNNLAYLAIIEAFFPQARHICLYRHCLDFVNSAAAMAARVFDFTPYLCQHNGHLTSALIGYWTEQTRALLEFERSHRERSFPLRYEDLVTDPPRVLRALFSFLKLDWDDRLLDQVFLVKHSEGVEDKNIRFTSRIITTSVGSGRAISLQGVSDELLAGMENLLQDLGYATENDAYAPPPTQRETVAADGPTLRWLFETHLQQQLRAQPKVASAIESSYCFDIAGEEGGIWFIEPSDGGPKISREGGEAACTIQASAADLIAIAEGRLNPMRAFEEQHLRVKGPVKFSELQTLTWLLTVSTAVGEGLS